MCVTVSKISVPAGPCVCFLGAVQSKRGGREFYAIKWGALAYILVVGTVFRAAKDRAYILAVRETSKSEGRRSQRFESNSGCAPCVLALLRRRLLETQSLCFFFFFSYPQRTRRHPTAIEGIHKARSEKATFFWEGQATWYILTTYVFLTSTKKHF